jgi:hypothetical protein
LAEREESRRSRKGIFAPQYDRKFGAQNGLHFRWHVKRNISKPETCALCNEVLSRELGIQTAKAG